MAALKLDDYGMLLLDKTHDAHDDLCAAKTAHDEVIGNILKAERFYYVGSSLRERDNVFIDLAIEFSGHVWMLEAYDTALHTHQLPHHVTLSENTMALFDQLRIYVYDTSPGSIALVYLKDTVIPAVFADARDIGRA